jgi:hypothetical protein
MPSGDRLLRVLHDVKQFLAREYYKSQAARSGPPPRLRNTRPLDFSVLSFVMCAGAASTSS